MCFGLYTLFADRVGKTGTGLDGLALSVTVAALATSPVSISHAPHMSAAQWGIIAASAVLGVAIPYTMDTLSGRITSARVSRNSSSCCWYSCSSAGMPSVSAWSMRRIR